MRLQKLAGALVNSSHHMQVHFTVTGSVQRSIVDQVLGKSPNIVCRTNQCSTVWLGGEGIVYRCMANNMVSS